MQLFNNLIQNISRCLDCLHINDSHLELLSKTITKIARLALTGCTQFLNLSNPIFSAGYQIKNSLRFFLTLQSDRQAYQSLLQEIKSMFSPYFKEVKETSFDSLEFIPNAAAINPKPNYEPINSYQIEESKSRILEEEAKALEENEHGNLKLHPIYINDVLVRGLLDDAELKLTYKDAREIVIDGRENIEFAREAMKWIEEDFKDQSEENRKILLSALLGSVTQANLHRLGSMPALAVFFTDRMINVEKKYKKKYEFSKVEDSIQLQAKFEVQVLKSGSADQVLATFNEEFTCRMSVENNLIKDEITGELKPIIIQFHPAAIR